MQSREPDEAEIGHTSSVASWPDGLFVMEVVNRQRQAFAVIEAYVTLAFACSWHSCVLLWVEPDYLDELSDGQPWR